MADRIVVMNHGVIEQIGTPLRGLPRPGDAVRRRLRRQDQRPRRAACTRAATCASARSRFACERRHRRAEARRQDLPASGRRRSRGRSRRRRRTSSTRVIDKIEFLGSYCLVTRQRRRRSASSRSRSYLSLNDLAEQGSQVGSRLPLRVAARADALLLAAAAPIVSAVLPLPAARALRQRVHWTDRVAHASLLVAGRRRSSSSWRCRWRRSSPRRCRTSDGALRRPRQFRRATSARRRCCSRSGTASGSSALVTLVTVPLAFGFAYALTRSCMPAKGAVPDDRAGAAARAVAAVGDLVHLLVRQPGHRSRAPDRRSASRTSTARPGIVVAECFAVFPHALMILVTALSLADARLYEAADALGTSTRRKFFTITLPGAKYGLISAALVVVHAGDHRLRHPQGDRRQLQHARHRHLQARDRPAGLPARRGRRPAAADAGGADLRRRLARAERKQTAMLSARAGAATCRSPSRGFDALMLGYCVARRALMLAMLGMAIFASFAKLLAVQPRAELKHYTMGLVDAEVGDAFVNSLKLGAPAPRSSARSSSSSAPTCSRRRAASTRCGRSCACWRCCRWRCRAWCWAWATSSSSTRPATRCTASTGRWRSWSSARSSTTTRRPPHRGDGAEADRRRVRGGVASLKVPFFRPSCA